MVAGSIVRCVLLVALVTVIYGAGLSGGFIFDDYPNLLADPSWQLQVMDLEGLRKALWGGMSSATGRPLAMLSFALNHYFFGLDPWWLKVVSVAWHALNAILLYQVLVLCLRVANEGARIGVHWIAVLAAAAWAVHPLHASSVLYVVQRMEIGAATGVLLALLCYLKGRLAIQGGQPWTAWAVGLVLAMVLGLGFKEPLCWSRCIHCCWSSSFSVSVGLAVVTGPCLDVCMPQGWSLHWCPTWPMRCLLMGWWCVTPVGNLVLLKDCSPKGLCWGCTWSRLYRAGRNSFVSITTILLLGACRPAGGRYCFLGWAWLGWQDRQS